jgi:hypothetical protein
MMIVNLLRTLCMFALSLLLLIVGCQQQSAPKAPNKARLVAKYKVLDETISPEHVKCGDIVIDFLDASPYTCSFKVQGLEFDIEDKYVVNAEGHLKEFSSYVAEGPISYSIDELKADTLFLRYNQLDNFHISLVNEGQAILDGIDTLAIERIFPIEKLLLARRKASTPKGRRFIYQYQ